MGLAHGAHRGLAVRARAEGIDLPIQLREERAEDRPGIHQLLVDAFPGPQEAKLVDALRGGGDLAISLVAEEDGELIGYLGLPRLKSPACALALAPVAVAPEHQGNGVGSLLIRDGIERARSAGEEIMFVVGEPAYYARFGFDLDAAREFPCAYSGPYFMALWLTDVRRKPAPVIYPAAFDDIE